MKRKFFAAFLSLCMVMSLVPTTVLATDETGSETRVKTVEEFKAAVATSGTVVLDEDLIFSTDDITAVPANVTLVLDMNGHSITVETNFTGRPIVNNGILTVTGDGTIDSTKSEFGGYGAIDNYGTLTIENGTYKGHVCADGAAVYNREGGTATINGGYFEGCRAVNNAGMMTINNGTFYTTSCNLTEDSNGNKNHWSYCVGSTGTLYFYDGTVTGVQGGLAVYDGYAEVYGGTFETVACDHAKDGRVSFYPLYVAGEEGEVEAHIYGGSYTAAYRYAVYCGNDNDGGIKEQATLYIHDGSFVGGYNVQAAVFQAEYTGNPSITGGTFQYKDSDQKIHKSDISVFLPEGAALEQDSDGAVITDVEMAASAVASVDGVSYATLQEAVNVAEENGTIEILKDFTIETAVSINKDLTIDGNKNTITAKGAAFYIKDDLGSLNIYDLVLKGAELGENAVAGEGNDATSGPWMGIGTYNGCYGVTDLKLTNVTIDGFSYGLYFGQNPSGNEGTNKEPVSITAEDLTIQNCYIKGAYFEKLTDSTFTDCKFLNNGTDSTKVAENFKQWLCGVDLNLKNGTYQNIKFDGCTFTNNGDNNGTALHIKARDDGNNYSQNPANLTGVTVIGCAFEGNNDTNMAGQAINPIVLGEPNANNKTPVNVSIQPDVAFTNNLAKEVEGAPVVVSFDSNGGTAVPSEIIAQGDYTLPAAPNRTGYYHFTGWSDGTTIYDAGETVTITADTTFTAVWSYTPPANPNYKITIGDMENGTVTANPTAAKAGATVTLTPVPDEGYALSTLTVTDRFGDAVRVTENSDGTYTFTMPNGQVTVTATFVETEAPVAEPFIDVAESDWFYDAVVYAYQNELMDGVGGNRFAPNSETTRAQLVTILYRLEGQPAVSGDLPFTDVEAGIWYTDAILWAAQNNIVNGVSDTEFAPGDDLTRQQLVTILYRYAEAKGYDVSASANLSGYPDADQVQDYAQPAMAWAVAENIIQGMEDGTLKPAGNASRAQIATILMRFCEDVAQ